MKIIYLLILLFFNQQLFGQKYLYSEKPIAIERFPLFNNSSADSVKSFINDSLIFPFDAMVNCIEGLVIIKFLLKDDATIDSIIFINKIGGGCDEEALRLLTLTKGKWTAGKYKGQNISVWLTMPIYFDNPNKECKISLDYYYRKADKYFYQKEWRMSLEYFNNVVRLNPYDENAFYKRSLCKLSLGFVSDACKDWSEMKKDAPLDLINKHCK